MKSIIFLSHLKLLDINIDLDPELFAAFSELNWEVRGLSSILMNQDVVHAYHTPSANGVETLPEDYFIQPDGRRMEFIVSVMEPKEGEDRYIMLFNKNTKRNTMECKFNVDLTGEVKWLEYFDPFTGEYIPVEIKDGVLEDTFRAGEGKVYRLRTDEPPVEETTPEETTPAPTEPVTEPATAPVTDAPATEAPTAQETADTGSKGCGSTLGLSVCLAVILPAIALSRGKKRKQD